MVRCSSGRKTAYASRSGLARRMMPRKPWTRTGAPGCNRIIECQSAMEKVASEKALLSGGRPSIEHSLPPPPPPLPLPPPPLPLRRCCGPRLLGPLDR